MLRFGHSFHPTLFEMIHFTTLAFPDISRAYIFGAHIALLGQIIFIFADANAGALHWRGQIDSI